MSQNWCPIDILDFIVPCIKFHRKHSRSYEHSLALTFMEILSKIPDSHISRKFGNKISKKTSNEANDLLKILDKDDSWDLASKHLKSLDYEYKKKGGMFLLSSLSIFLGLFNPYSANSICSPALPHSVPVPIPFCSIKCNAASFSIDCVHSSVTISCNRCCYGYKESNIAVIEVGVIPNNLLNILYRQGL